MHWKRASAVSHYGLAVVMIGMATGVRLLLDPILGDKVPFAPFFLAILVTASVGGFGPALFATVLGALSSAYFIWPSDGTSPALNLNQQVGFGLYLVASLGIGLVGSVMRATRRSLEATSQDALERQRQQEQLEERARLALFGKDVALALNQADTLPDMLRHCAAATVSHLHGAFARIWILNEADNVLELVASAGMYTHLDGPHSRVPVGKFKIGLIAQERKPHLTNSVVGDPRVGDQAWAKREKMVAFAGYPLLIEDRLVGVMAMFARQPLSEATLEAMASVANGIASGIERKHAEEQLREQREWLRVTFASIGDAVITTDTIGRVTFLNSVAEELTGWDQNSAKGQLLETVFSIVHEQTRQSVENPVAKVLREGRAVGLANHTVLLARDGTEKPIDDSAAPIKTEDGTILGVVLIFRDFTQQRLAERELRESEARKSAILATAIDCIITSDQHGIIQEFNPAAERTFGYTRAEAVGRDMADLIVAPALRERHRKGMAHYLATGHGPILDRRIEMPALRGRHGVSRRAGGHAHRSRWSTAIHGISSRHQRAQAQRSRSRRPKAGFGIAGPGCGIARRP